jgi:hypothetical protein
VPNAAPLACRWPRDGNNDRFDREIASAGGRAGQSENSGHNSSGDAHPS